MFRKNQKIFQKTPKKPIPLGFEPPVSLQANCGLFTVDCYQDSGLRRTRSAQIELRDQQFLTVGTLSVGDLHAVLYVLVVASLAEFMSVALLHEQFGN